MLNGLGSVSIFVHLVLPIPNSLLPGHFQPNDRIFHWMFLYQNGSNRFREDCSLDGLRKKLLKPLRSSAQTYRNLKKAIMVWSQINSFAGGGY